MIRGDSKSPVSRWAQPASLGFDRCCFPDGQDARTRKQQMTQRIPRASLGVAQTTISRWFPPFSPILFYARAIEQAKLRTKMRFSLASSFAAFSSAWLSLSCVRKRLCLSARHLWQRACQTEVIERDPSYRPTERRDVIIAFSQYINTPY